MKPGAEGGTAEMTSLYLFRSPKSCITNRQLITGIILDSHRCDPVTAQPKLLRNYKMLNFGGHWKC